MNCPTCGKDNPSEGRFCIFCGATLLGPVSPEETSPPEAVEGQSTSLQDELRELRRMVVQLTDRMAALERLQGGRVPQTPQEAPVTPPPHPRSADTAPPPLSPEILAARIRAAEARRIPMTAPAAEPSEPRGPVFHPFFRDISIDWEQVLGLNWLAIIGAVALAVGMGFFLRLAFENDWIGETGRVILGIGTGVVLLGIGEFAQRRIPAWAQAVTGGGIGILYLSIYSAFGFYDLVDPVPALLFLGLVVAISGLLALRYESLVIALLGMFGAFLTPLLLGRDLPSDQQYVLLAYILVVDLGILGVSTFRNWRWFTLVGLVASYALFGLWLDQISDRDLLLAQGGLTGIFLVFAGATTLFHILWRRVPGPADMALMTLNAAAFFGMTYGLLWDQYEVWFGLITLGLSLFYGIVGYGAIVRSGSSPQVALYSLAAALVFLTVAVPLQLSGTWITVAWAAEGAVLVWVGFVLQSWPTRAFGLGVLAIAAFNLLVFNTPVELDGFTLILNERFPPFVVSIAAFYVAAYLYWRARDRLEEWETNVFLILVGAANLFTLWILSAEVIAFFDSRALAAGTAQVAQNAENGRYLSLTAMWAVYAFGILAIALAKRSRLLRWAGLALLSIPVFMLLFVNTFVVILNPLTFRLILNFHFLTFLIVLAALIFAAYLYWRQREELFEEERYVFPVLLVAAIFVALWVLSAEIFRFFDSREIVALRTDSIRAARDANNGILLSLTALWAIYAFGLLSVALWKHSRLVRWAGLALASVAVFKLVFVDTFAVKLNPETFRLILNFHFLIFLLVLGVVLFAAYLYWRHREELLEEERDVFTALVVVANIVAVWVLSAEAIRFFDSREVRLGNDFTSAKHLSLTILWTVYAIGVIVAGIIRKSSRVRLVGLALLGIPVLKLFVFDVFLLEQGYRVGAFVGLGALLLATGLVYQRYSKAIRGFMFGKSP